jgi:hypothetical protein
VSKIFWTCEFAELLFDNPVTNSWTVKRFYASLHLWRKAAFKEIYEKIWRHFVITLPVNLCLWKGKEKQKIIFRLANQGFRKMKMSLKNRIEAVSASVLCTQAHESAFLSSVRRNIIDIGLERKILVRVYIKKQDVIVWPGPICRQAR